MSEKKVRVAVFPVAGMGTRFLPATKSIPKEMLPIVDRPIIQYAVDEAIQAGCDTLIFVTGASKRAVEDYFSPAPELEAELLAKGKTTELALIQSILPPNIKVHFVRQDVPLGLGHAVLCAAQLVGAEEHFAVLLPDDLIDGYPEGALSQMIPTALTTGCSVVAVEQVAKADVSQYGIVAFDPSQGTFSSPSNRVKAIVEKPSVEEAPSSTAVVGRYVLHRSIFDHLRTQTAGRGGEIQLTDAISKQLETTGVMAYRFSGKRFDCGSKRGYLVANVHFGLK
jgi:UTP--glucose-1-phosphate uridylyltransferase